MRSDQLTHQAAANPGFCSMKCSMLAIAGLPKKVNFPAPIYTSGGREA